MNKQRIRKLNNAGLSLVELIVTILIIAIISSGVIVTLNVVNRVDSEKTTRVFISEMTHARQRAMALAGESNDVFLRLYYNSEGDYMTDLCQGNVGDATFDVLSTEKLGNRGEKIHLGTKLAAEADRLLLAADGDLKEVRYSFSKNSGGLINVVTIDSADTVGFYEDASGTLDPTRLLVDVYVEGDGLYHVIVVKGSGRCYLYE